MFLTNVVIITNFFLSLIKMDNFILKNHVILAEFKLLFHINDDKL